MNRTKHRILAALALVLALFAAVLLAFPWWFPRVLPPVASHFEVKYSAYERLGTRRFALLNVEIARKGITFRARRVEAPSPLSWVWRRYVGKEGPGVVRVDGWNLNIPEHAPETQGRPPSPLEPPGPGSNPPSVSRIATDARAQLATAQAWLPRGEFTDGVLEVSGTRLTLDEVKWNGSVLSGVAASPSFGKAGTVQARLPADAPWQVTARVRDYPLELNLSLFFEPMMRIEGTAVWLTNQVALEARFPEEGVLPQSASARARRFHIPAEILKLEGYEDLAGSFEFIWETNQYHLNLDAAAKPLPDRTPALFPVTTLVRAEGGLSTGRLEQLVVRCPWLSADLSDPVAFSYRGELLSEEAALNFAADLSRQSWIPAAGRFRGRADVRPGENRVPDAAFAITGEALEYSGVRADSMQLTGKFAWPWLEITRAEARFGEAAAAVTARADLQKRSLASGVVHVDGKVGEGLLPSGSSVERVVLHANAHGPIDELTHSGALELEGFNAPRLAPLTARANWRGRGADLDFFEAAAHSGTSTLQIAGSANGSDRAGLRFEQLTLSTNGQPVYQLERPLSVTLRRPGGTESGWRLAVEPFRWTGPGHELSLRGGAVWPVSGDFDVAAKAFDTAAFQGFFEPALPAVRLDHLEAAAHWTNGPLVFQLNGGTRFQGGRGLDLSAVLAAQGNSNGISVTEFKVANQSATVLSGSGFVPVTVTPSDSKRMLHVHDTAPIELQAATVSNRPFWDTISAMTKAGLVDPRLDISLSGSIAQPKGRIVARIAAVRLDQFWTNQEPPRLERLVAEIGVSRTAIQVHQLDFTLENQPVSVQGQVPLGPELSANWREFIQWDQATGNLRVPRADLAPVARFWPEILAPQGHVEINATVAPGMVLGGGLSLRGAATRPLPGIGPLNDLDCEINLSGRQAKLRSFSGLIGGEPFRFEGTIDLGRRNPQTGLPLIDLTLDALNIPLARRPDLIVRADLDLAIDGATNAPPVVSGDVRLRDSVFLSDLKMLIPGKIEQPRQRPPYFSVDLEPLASFGLDLRVSGSEFLKVRTPFFRGDISADLAINGTLENPVALGEVTIASGVVQFPFANLEVNQGVITLTSEDPYRPALFVTAGARTFGYEVKMEVRGKADAPVLEFSSIPPLNSEQVLLMLASGEVPTRAGAVSRQQRAGRLALFLGKNLLSEFTGGSGNADRLSVRSGEDISETGRQTYSLEYRLSEDWSVVGEYDRFGAFNVDLKWRLYSR